MVSPNVSQKEEVNLSWTQRIFSLLPSISWLSRHYFLVNIRHLTGHHVQIISFFFQEPCKFKPHGHKDFMFSSFYRTSITFQILHFLELIEKVSTRPQEFSSFNLRSYCLVVTTHPWNRIQRRKHNSDSTYFFLLGSRNSRDGPEVDFKQENINETTQEPVQRSAFRISFTRSWLT